MIDVVMRVQVLECVEGDIGQGAPLNSTFQPELLFSSAQNMSPYGYRCYRNQPLGRSSTNNTFFTLCGQRLKSH